MEGISISGGTIGFQGFLAGKKKRSRLKWVSDLFKSGSRDWDHNIIRHLFYHHDAEEILKLQFNPRGMVISLLGILKRMDNFQ